MEGMLRDLNRMRMIYHVIGTLDAKTIENGKETIFKDNDENVPELIQNTKLQIWEAQVPRMLSKKEIYS